MIRDYDNENSIDDIPYKKPVTYTIHETYTLDRFEQNDNINVEYIDDKYFKLRSPLNIGTGNPYKIKIRDFVYRNKDYSEKAYLRCTDSYNVTYWPLKLSVDGNKAVRIDLDGNLPSTALYLEPLYVIIYEQVIRPVVIPMQLQFYEYPTIFIRDQYDRNEVENSYRQLIINLNTRLETIVEALNDSFRALIPEGHYVLTTTTVGGVVTSYNMNLLKFIFIPYEFDEANLKLLGGNISLIGWNNGNAATIPQNDTWDPFALMMFTPYVKIDSLDDNNNISDNVLYWSYMYSWIGSHTGVSAVISDANHLEYGNIYRQVTTAGGNDYDVIPTDDELANYRINWSNGVRIPGGCLFGSNGVVEIATGNVVNYVFNGLTYVNLIFDVNNPEDGYDFDFDLTTIDGSITQFDTNPSNVTTIVISQVDTHIPQNLYLKWQGCMNSTETIACNNEKEHSKIKNFRINTNEMVCYLTESCNTKIPVSLLSITFSHHIAICMDWKYYKNNRY